MRNNTDDKYWVVDYNGFTHATATTMNAAKARAKQVRDAIGIHVCVNYADRWGTHLLWYRSKTPVHFQTNGWMVKAK